MWTALGGRRDQVGESPVWDADRDTVWWVDIWGRTINRQKLGHAVSEHYPTREMVGGIALEADGSILALMETGLFRLEPATGTLEFVSAPPDLPSTHRFNDVTVDPQGRLIAGTMRKSQEGPAEPTGVLYVYDGMWRRLFSGFWAVNGLAFAPDGQTLYLSDSHPSVQTVWAAPYRPDRGAVGARDVFIDMTPLEGRPDGAAVGADGDYWLAGVGGGRLYRFDDSGRLRQDYPLPVECPTKPVFAGAHLDQLIVTSLSIHLTSPDPEGLAGALLSARIDTVGSRIAPARLPPARSEPETS